MVRTILMLGTVVSAVLVPVFIGHALASHQTWPIGTALVLLAIAAVAGVLSVRASGRARPVRSTPAP